MALGDLCAAAGLDFSFHIRQRSADRRSPERIAVGPTLAYREMAEGLGPGSAAIVGKPDADSAGHLSRLGVAGRRDPRPGRGSLAHGLARARNRTAVWARG